MKVMVLVKATKSSEAGELPSEQLLTEMGQFNEQLIRAGIMKAGEGLKPSSEAKRVHFRGSDRSVTDGPLQRRLTLSAASVEPYLFFGGRCEEALTFYEQALGATIMMKMRFDESPDPVPAGMLQAGFGSKIMHASFTVGKTTIMASDGCDEQSRFAGFRLALSVPTAADADSTFAELATGGQVDMPLTETFWSPRYGMVTDRFGVGWMVMVPGETSCGG